MTAVSADHPSFHVVAPSLPGYAWSEGVLEKGFHAEHYAEVSVILLLHGSILIELSLATVLAQLFNKLMISLGYSEYVTQGGDWGHVVRTPPLFFFKQHVS